MFGIPTSIKVKIAKLISAVLTKFRSVFGLPSILKAHRRGIYWLLDLQEGIDLAIYLGVYEVETLDALSRVIKPGYVALDIGANIGALTLPMAKYVGSSGKVIAFEPTAWAFEKLQRNVLLNPTLSKKIKLENTMLLESSQVTPNLVYSSWSLSEKEDEKTHPKHKGRLMPTDGANAISLDEYVEENSLGKVDLIKLDVDGYELAVLEGAKHLLSRDRPHLILEIAPHLQEEREGLSELLAKLKNLNYRLVNLKSDSPLPFDSEKLGKICPKNGSINVLVVPTNKASV